jgi:putative endonuclease
MSWVVYLLKLNNDTYYTGITNNIFDRMKKHQSGKGSKYVRAHRPFSLIGAEEYKTRSEASKREYNIKKLTKQQKINLGGNMGFPIKPLFDRVFVKKDSADKTESGFHLPQTVKGRAVTGTVVAVGDGHLNIDTGEFVPLVLNVGDRVYVKEFSGYTIRWEGEEVYVFQAGEIIGKLVG